MNAGYVLVLVTAMWAQESVPGRYVTCCDIHMVSAPEVTPLTAEMVAQEGSIVYQGPSDPPFVTSGPSRQVPQVTASPGVELKLQKNGDVIAQPTKLQCGKYEHEQLILPHCANACSPESTICTAQCRFVDLEDKCVDDMHEVTEKEWQRLTGALKVDEQMIRILVERLKALEGRSR